MTPITKKRIKPMKQIVNYLRLQRDLRNAAKVREWQREHGIPSRRWFDLEDEVLKLDGIIAREFEGGGQ